MKTLPSPTDIRDYLRLRGWQQIDAAIQDRLYVLSNPKFERRQISIPIDEDKSDFAETVLRGIEKIASLEETPVERLIAKILNIKSDTLRFSVVTGWDDDVALPLSFAAEAISGAQQMLLSAACTVIAPKIHHPRLARNEAQSLLNVSRFGHTEEGSFVFKISCPLNDPATQLMLANEFSDVNFARRTTETIAESIDGLVSAIEADALTKFVDTLKSDATPTISSNFCEALSRLHDESINNSVRFSVDWSLAQDVNNKLRKSREIKREYFPRIEEVHQELRKVEKALDSVFMGTVEELNGEMGEDGRRSGEVVLSLLSNEFDSAVRARCSLSAEDYDKAHQAHKSANAFVQVKGKLKPGRQPRQLIDVSELRIIGLKELLG